MSRAVRLQDIDPKGQKSGNSDTAFRAPDKKYYSSEEAYNRIIADKSWRNKIIVHMYYIMGYSYGMVLPTVFYKKLAGLEAYGYEVVYDTIIGEESSIKWAIRNKRFQTETGKLLYIMSIIVNKINDYYKKKQHDRKALEKKQETPAVADVNFEEIGRKTETTTDASSFLGGEEWI